jgi:hypothetical protein
MAPRDRNLARLLRHLTCLGIACALAASVAGPARAQGVKNGGFDTGDLSFWSRDTDGATGGADFSVVSGAARIEADTFDVPGDITSGPKARVFLANTLFQALDTTAPPGETLFLSFDWRFDGQDGNASGGDVFAVGFGDGSGALHGADGQLGHVLAPTASYGSGHVAVALSPAAFNNAGGWTVEFQLGVGVDPDHFRPNAEGSFVEIDNVALTLPEPGGLAPAALGVAALLGLRGARDRRRAARCGVVVVLALVSAAASSARAEAWATVPDVTMRQTLPEFDRVHPGLASHVTITNGSGTDLADRLRLVVDATLPVTNADGRTGAYDPFFDVPALPDGGSVTIRVTFARVRAPLHYTARLEHLAPASEALGITSDPTLTMDPTGTTPLAGVIHAETNIPSRGRLTVARVDDGDTFTVEFPEFATEHSLPLLGLKPGTVYSVLVEFIDQQGVPVSSTTPLIASTLPLPADFPQTTLIASQPDRMEPGYTLLDKYNVNLPSSRYLAIFDALGEVVWYGTFGDLAVTQSPNGNLLLGPADYSYEIDMLGNNVEVIPLNPGIEVHHDLFRTAYGSFLMLGKRSFIEPSYPTSDVDPDAPPASAEVAGDVPLELAPDGSLLNAWPLEDRIDPTRIGYDALESGPLGKDWTHANAITHDPRDDSLLVSLRHQDAVLKISRYTGKLIWILGNHSNWKPEYEPYLLTPVASASPFEWQYHQHAIDVTPSGTYMLFDNGNYRASPFDGNTPLPDVDNYSRAVEYAVDEDTKEVSQVWEWGGDVSDPIFSWFVSDADAQPRTGNVVILYGGMTYYDHQPISSQAWGNTAIRIVEVTHEAPAEKVFDMVVYVPGTTSVLWSFRAERIPSLYPPNVIVTHDLVR